MVAGPAARAISDELPEAVAWAVIELITGPLLENPHRVGRELRGELTGIWSARRGDFRVLYRIDEAKQRCRSCASITVEMCTAPERLRAG